MTKTDFKKTLDSYHAKVGEFRTVELVPRQYLMVDGQGDPNTSQQYANALAALYPMAYKLKFASKRELNRDYVVPPLEALWWAEDFDVFTRARDKSRWDWTAMILTPDWLSGEDFDAARSAAGAKNPPAALDQVRLETLHEGLCVQTLHLGSYDDEGPVLERLHHEHIPSSGLRMTGKHHEIYLSDPRRVESARLRTILRQPVAPA